MISVCFWCLTHSAQCFLSSTSSPLLRFQPVRSIGKCYLEITKEEDRLYQSSACSLEKPRLPPSSNRDHPSDIWQNALFLHASESGVTVVLSRVNSDALSEGARYRLGFAAHRLACLYCALRRTEGTFPTRAL